NGKVTTTTTTTTSYSSSSSNGGHPQVSSQSHFQQQSLSSVEGQAATGAVTGRRRALLIGINYFKTKAELRGCINDVKNVHSWLSTSYPDFARDMRILTDDQTDAAKKPTRANIVQGFKWLVEGAKAGDSLFLHYSGHGGTHADTDGDEADGHDETILPLDWDSAGEIFDDEIHTLLLRDLPAGVRFAAVFDSCHSGSVMDLPYTYTLDGNLDIVIQDNRKVAFKHAMTGLIAYAQGNKSQAISEAQSAVKAILFKKTTKTEAISKAKETRTTKATVVMFSGCRDEQTSADAHIDGQATGAMSWGLMTTLKAHQSKDISYLQLLRELRGLLQGKYSQIPQMSTGFHMDMNQPFR
ncbi:Ca(2+)-dependent cysteine protease, partial [Quaeritorhiza haematococci]